MDLAIVFLAFWIFFLASMFPKEARERLKKKTGADLALDLGGLLVQGALVPLFALHVLPRALFLFIPSAKGALDLSPLPAFLANFVGVDALYYYNHRALHSRALWKAHVVHHTMTELDVLGTSRNTVWTPLLIVYAWANGTMLYLLRDPSYYALAMAITAALDLFRHSSVAVRPGTLAHSVFAPLFITPHEHAWHHSKNDPGCNFGANLSLWDRLHGTYRSPKEAPAELGVTIEGTLLERALAPYSLRERVIR